MSKGYADNLLIVLTAAGVSLMANSILEIHLIDWKLSICIATLFGAVLSWQVNTAIFNEKFSQNIAVGTLLVGLFFGVPYSYGTLTFLNIVLDTSPKTTFETKVLEKYKSGTLVSNSH